MALFTKAFSEHELGLTIIVLVIYMPVVLAITAGGAGIGVMARRY